jgi:hypothetical protein
VPDRYGVRKCLAERGVGSSVFLPQLSDGEVDRLASALLEGLP